MRRQPHPPVLRPQANAEMMKWSRYSRARKALCSTNWPATPSAALSSSRAPGQSGRSPDGVRDLADGDWYASGPFDTGETTRRAFSPAASALGRGENPAAVAREAANRDSQANGALMRIGRHERLHRGHAPRGLLRSGGRTPAVGREDPLLSAGERTSWGRAPAPTDVLAGRRARVGCGAGRGATSVVRRGRAPAGRDDSGRVFALRIGLCRTQDHRRWFYHHC